MNVIFAYWVAHITRLSNEFTGSIDPAQNVLHSLRPLLDCLDVFLEILTTLHVPRAERPEFPYEIVQAKLVVWSVDEIFLKTHSNSLTTHVALVFCVIRHNNIDKVVHQTVHQEVVRQFIQLYYVIEKICNVWSIGLGANVDKLEILVVIQPVYDEFEDMCLMYGKVQGSVAVVVPVAAQSGGERWRLST